MQKLWRKIEINVHIEIKEINDKVYVHMTK